MSYCELSLIIYINTSAFSEALGVHVTRPLGQLGRALLQILPVSPLCNNTELYGVQSAQVIGDHLK